MRNMVFERKGTGKIIRISKQKARKFYEQGKDVLFIPCNLRPDSPFMLGIWENKNLDGQYINFDTLVSYYESYNCSDNETGKYAAFYVAQSDIQ